ncbi:hypothetical protein EDEG_02951 [Edhazardia aedis USNM 41457]|uniref:Uncharacterized protein n=1 Tax=Edhazardia aedis (strain USNM 41457) TaxID=1003232 RepID=J9D550_EDHAE|nr:hypothetical protein EDEG_02951 [Edhazardia aedis USNM 41457]|eukprot:EJW02654.1 hypothetical protein EDEG_02951 [Edhazardia aedis USNM 41457]
MRTKICNNQLFTNLYTSLVKEQKIKSSYKRTLIIINLKVLLHAYDDTFKHDTFLQGNIKVIYLINIKLYTHKNNRMKRRINLKRINPEFSTNKKKIKKTFVEFICYASIFKMIYLLQ